MGVASWVIAGVAVLAASRFAPPGRPSGWIGEALVALASALVFGLAATALDFGGWKEPDWRAAAFALAGAAAVIGLGRVVRLRAEARRRL